MTGVSAMSDRCQCYEWQVSVLWVTGVSAMSDRCQCYKWQASVLWVTGVSAMSDVCQYYVMSCRRTQRARSVVSVRLVTSTWRETTPRAVAAAIAWASPTSVSALGTTATRWVDRETPLTGACQCIGSWKGGQWSGHQTVVRTSKCSGQF